MVQRLALVVERGRWDEVRIEVVDPVIAASARPAAWRTGMAWALAAAGREREARAELETVAADGFAGLPDDTNLLSCLCELTEAAALLGNGALARVAAERLAPYTAHNVVNARAASCYGAAALFAGRALAVAGDRTGARARLIEAVERNEAMGARPRALHARALLGRLTGDERLVAEASAEAGALGMSPDALR
jgi:hypothetical protein